MSAKDVSDIVYRILDDLEECLDHDKACTKNIVSHEYYNISEIKHIRIMEMLLNEGFITGIEFKKYMGADIPCIFNWDLRITLKGINYLNENSKTTKIINAAKIIADLIP